MLFYVVLVLSSSVEMQSKVVDFVTTVFIRVSIGTLSVKINQETWELWSKIETFLWLSVYVYVWMYKQQQ